MGIDLTLDNNFFPGLSNQRPLVIAGPCSAESEEQMITTAQQLQKQDIHVFRAGIWKPRTRPNAFEGYGSQALPWLKKVKDETGMFVSTEVANVKHVYEALKYGVDMIWIGARTSANPFAVQEIADTLRGVDIPVFIKNPVNPDVELWIGAIERINRAGIKKIAAIHRGFSTYDRSPYRNDPHWQLPIELKRRIPELAIITDPSHICGNRHLLYDVSQKAMDLNFEGLIIESHRDPDVAMSDAKQQITPDEVGELIRKLVLRQPDIDNELLLTLEELRAGIDKCDDTIMNIFEDRMKIAEQIGEYKRDKNVTILQSKRWDHILNKRLEDGELRGLSNEFVNKIFRAIHQESINHQTKVMNQKPAGKSETKA